MLSTPATLFDSSFVCCLGVSSEGRNDGLLFLVLGMVRTKCVTLEEAILLLQAGIVFFFARQFSWRLNTNFWSCQVRPLNWFVYDEVKTLATVVQRVNKKLA